MKNLNCANPPGELGILYLQLLLVLKQIATKLLRAAFRDKSTPDPPMCFGGVWPSTTFPKAQLPSGTQGARRAVSSPGCMILGLAPKYARLTLAFLPSMMGLGSLHARSAAALSAMVTFRGEAPR